MFTHFVHAFISFYIGTAFQGSSPIPSNRQFNRNRSRRNYYCKVREAALPGLVLVVLGAREGRQVQRAQGHQGPQGILLGQHSQVDRVVLYLRVVQVGQEVQVFQEALGGPVVLLDQGFL